jgi:hypothetical protein
MLESLQTFYNVGVINLRTVGAPPQSSEICSGNAKGGQSNIMARGELTYQVCPPDTIQTIQ